MRNITLNYTLQEEMLAEDSTEAESVVPGESQEAPDAGQVMVMARGCV